MSKLTLNDCALNAAEVLRRAADAQPDRQPGLLGVADQWVRLLDAMTRAGMGVAERES